MRKRKILSTLGPASLNAKMIQRLDQLGVDIFRLNLSHTNLEDVGTQIKLIKQATRRPICLDTEGAQIRTGRMKAGPVFLKLNSLIRFSRRPVEGEEGQLNLHPAEACDLLQEGDILHLDFNSAIVQVIAISLEFISARVLAEGAVGQNKGVTLERPFYLPPLTLKDRRAIEIGLELGVEYVALSFASRPEDVEDLRRLIGPGIKLISKIESISGLENLSEIMVRSDAILIDRGDLGREVLLQALPSAQKAIIKSANSLGTPVYVATNLLESMVSRSQPTRAEVNDVMNTLLDGADGLVLAAETAIGQFPSECVVMIDKLIKYFEQQPAAKRLGKPFHHWDHNISNWKSDISKKKFEPCYSIKLDALTNKTPRLVVDESVILDATQIATGVFSPLSGFMTEHQLASVLENYRLPDGEVWTLPILLQLNAETATRFRLGDEVLLNNRADRQDYALLTISDIFTQDLHKLAREWFGTDSLEHPGVCKLLKGGDHFLGGPLTLLRRKTISHQRYELLPEQIKDIFESRRWETIAGFHTRNVPHLGHEKLLRLTLENSAIDGVLISPVIGPKKSGDYDAEIIMKSYELLIDRNKLPVDKVILAAFSSYPRYAGPREAVFTAICRRNLGCTHFIIGRDHTGVKNFYRENDSQKLFTAIGDIGIKPLFFGALTYCQECDDYLEACEHMRMGLQRPYLISGTEVRGYYSRDEAPPAWLIRSEISELILHELSQGKRVFAE